MSQDLSRDVSKHIVRRAAWWGRAGRRPVRLVAVVAAALVAVTAQVAPAWADGGNTRIWTGPTISAALVPLANGNWEVTAIGTGFPENYGVILVVEDLSQPSLDRFVDAAIRTTAGPTMYCPDSSGCVVYPAGSVLPPAFVWLQRSTVVNGVTTSTEKAHCGDSLIAQVVNGDAVQSNTVSLTVPPCPAGSGGSSGGGGGGSGGSGGGSRGGGPPPGPHPM